MVDLRKIRQVARISQVELSMITHISRPRLSAAENGYLELTNDELVAIHEVIARVPTRLATKIRQALDDQETSELMLTQRHASRGKE
jgi:transcriptional regulator with XRE-family HTH domain